MSLEKCLSHWEIPKEKVLQIMSDNGANMVKAVNLLRERATAEEDEVADDEEAVDGCDDTGDENPLLVTELPYRRLGCLAHSLQLVIKEVYKGPYSGIIAKTRGLVGRISKSSVAMEKVISKCGKGVISDNSTRWNSTYMMSQRLLEVKVPLNEVLTELNIDSLLTSEWAQLEQLVSLLQPFCSQTDILQRDAMSLSNTIPSIFDLQCHLHQFPSAKSVTHAMLQDLSNRFSPLLQPDHPEFNPLPAAVCLLDPTCASFILGFDESAIRDGAKAYILARVSIEISAHVLKQC